MNKQSPSNLTLISKKLLLPATFACILSLSSCKKDKEEASGSGNERLVVAAQSYLNQHQYRAAILEVRNALKESPNNQAAELYARIFIEVGQADLASDFIESYGPSSLELSRLLVDAFLEQKKYYSAQRALKSFDAGQLDPVVYTLMNARIAAGLKNYAEAAKHVDGALSVNPSSEDANLLKLKIATITDNDKRAKEAIAALNVDTSESADVFVTLAQIAASKDDYAQAETHLMQSLRYLPNADVLTPQKSTALLLLIETLTNQGRYSDAVPYSQLLSKANPQWQKNKDKMESAIALLQSGDLNAAERVFREMQKDNPNITQASAMLGLINLQKGDVVQAAKLLEENVDPETSPVVFTSAAAFALLKTDELNDAIDMLDKALQVKPDDPQLLTIYGLAATRSADLYKKGIASLQKVTKAQPESGRYLIALAQGYYNGDDKKRGLDTLLSAHEKAPKNAAINSHIAKQLIREKQLDEANSFVNNLVKSTPKVANSWLTKALTEVQLGNNSQAMASLNRAASLDKTSYDVFYARALLATETKDFTQAEKDFESAINIRPGSIGAYIGFLRVTAQAKGEEAAVGALNRMSKKTATKLSANLILADYYQNKGNNTLAQKAFSKINFTQAKEEPKESAPLVEAVYVNITAGKVSDLLKSNKKNDVRKILDTALDHYPNSVRMMRLAAGTYIEQNELAQAASIASKLRQENEENFATLVEVEILLKQKDYRPAYNILNTQWEKQPAINIGRAIINVANLLDETVDNSVLTKWKAQFPSSEEPYLYGASQHLKADNKEQAIAEYAALISAQPNNVKALNNSAWLEFESDNMTRALELADRVFLLAPEAPSVLDTVGWIKVNNKDESGLALLEKAHSLAPSNQAIKENLIAAKKLLNR